MALPGSAGDLACWLHIKGHVHLPVGAGHALDGLHQLALLQLAQHLCEERLLQVRSCLQVLRPKPCARHNLRVYSIRNHKIDCDLFI